MICLHIIKLTFYVYFWILSLFLVFDTSREVDYDWFMGYVSILSLHFPPGYIQYDYYKTLRISLNPQLRYYVNLYDPKYSLTTSNPKTVPRIMLNIGERSGYFQVYIEVRPRVAVTCGDVEWLLWWPAHFLRQQTIGSWAEREADVSRAGTTASQTVSTPGQIFTSPHSDLKPK